MERELLIEILERQQFLSGATKDSFHFLETTPPKLWISKISKGSGEMLKNGTLADSAYQPGNNIVHISNIRKIRFEKYRETSNFSKGDSL